MPASQSFLSSPKYGYDFVVATTQASINATLGAFLESRQDPGVTICYTEDENGQTILTDFEKVKSDAQNADPFSSEPLSDQALDNLWQAGFSTAIRARIGIPQVDDVSTLPPIVALGADTSRVTFNLMCSEFVIVELLAPRRGGKKLVRIQQGSTPWIISTKVDLRLVKADQSAYNKLPPAVQEQIKNLSGTAFSVQQLLFDLDNAGLSEVPTITGLDPTSNAESLLTRFFVNGYFSQMKKEGQPLLGASVVPKTAWSATLTLTNLNFGISPCVGSDGQPISNPQPADLDLTTLNYLCAADGASLPPAVPFNWNWVDASEIGDHHGVLAINRRAFANFFQERLKDYVPKVCLKPSVRVWYDWGKAATYYSSGVAAGQNPAVTFPEDGALVLKYSYTSPEASDEAGVNGALGREKLSSSFDLSLSFSGTQITLTQHLVIWLYVKVLATDADANIYDKTLTDVWNIGIDANGALTAASQSTDTVDKSSVPQTDWFQNFWTGGFNDLGEQIAGWVRPFAGQSQHQLPIDQLRSYIFPGGQTFAFKNARFSDKGDLTASITYVDPTSPVAVPSEH